ncbi:hypothetical protein C0Q70_05895 [Pomacea canaliculata]|uniref:Uncharacterized protein n=1 Tax=Pomacea canaliculata TaxID=400727 RepID=A0A2T7PMI0_POMCA|nr:hypothetical protein C0Q70_05895 [Pomacea canaliculata]
MLRADRWPQLLGGEGWRAFIPTGARHSGVAVSQPGLHTRWRQSQAAAVCATHQCQPAMCG